MTQQQIIKITFDKKVEFTSVDVKTNKFVIYHRENTGMEKFEMPLEFIDEYVYIDENDYKCPVCNSSNIINEIPESNEVEVKTKTEKIDVRQVIDDIINDTIDVESWECLSCGSSNQTIDKFNDENIFHEISDLDIDNSKSDDSGRTKLSFLRLNGFRYDNGLHWFRVPRRLLRNLKKLGLDHSKTIPSHKYYESANKLILEYTWSHTPHNMEDTRVCGLRYLRPPKEFNRAMLKYKYPNIWIRVDADVMWSYNENPKLILTWNIRLLDD